MKTYRPSGTCTSQGVLTLLLLSLTGAVVIGGVAHFIGQWLYLIILFPILMGLGAGMVVSMGITSAKCRNYNLAVGVALLAGVATYGSMHYFDYLAFRKEAIGYILEDAAAEGAEEVVVEDGEEPVEMNEELASRMLDMYMEIQTGYGGIIGYVLTSASEGVSIGSVSNGDGANIGRIGTFIYWGLEFLAILFFAYSGASKAKDPFCENCEVWYEDTPMTHTSIETVDGIVESMKQEKYTDVVSQIQSTNEMPCVRITGSMCPTCSESDAVIKFEAVTLNDKGNEDTKDLHNQMVPILVFKEIVDGIAQKEPIEEALERTADVEAS